VLPRLTLSARAGRYRAEIGEGRDEELPSIQEVFAPSAVPGLAASPDFLRFGAAAVIDSRDVMGNPHRGAVLAVQWQRYDGRGESHDRFDRMGVDARVFIPLGHPQRVLALRAYGSQDAPGAGARVPFYLLSYLGGSHTLRAYLSQRFRGERLALFQAEYRWEAAPALELAAFVDSGAVAATRDDELDRFRSDAGIGLRLKSHEAALLRLDFAWGGEGFRFLFRFSTSY
jgi:outer membrane protein assembly factor BamA